MSDGNQKANEWFARASSDLQYAQAGERETAQHHVTCFLCQQVVEKTLKGLLAAAGKALEKTHHLGRLATLALPFYHDLRDHIPALRHLDKYYVAARYPDDLATDFTAADAQEALRIAATVLDFAHKAVR